MGDHVAGVGLEAQGKVRSSSEMLERYALRRGPSKNIYFLNSEPGDKSSKYYQNLINNYSDILDSSGSATNGKIEYSLKSAYMEFRERQSLISAWKFGYNYSVVDSGYTKLGAKYEAREISLFENVSVILTLLKRKFGEVSYAVGCAASESLKFALQKSINELDQSIILMEDNIQRKTFSLPLMDEIQEEYLKSNTEMTYSKWQQTASKPYFNLSNGNFNVIEALKLLPHPPLIMVDNIYFDDSVYYFVRIVSEKWFLGLRDTRIPEVYQKLNLSEINQTPVPFG